MHDGPSLVVDAAVSEVDVAVVVEVEVVGEVEANALGLGGERGGEAAVGADLEEAEVGVGDVEVPRPPVESEAERAAADVLVLEVVERRRLVAAELGGPVRGGVREVDPAGAVPAHDAAVGDAGVGSPAERVERDALGALHLAAEPDLRAAEALAGVRVGGISDASGSSTTWGTKPGKSTMLPVRSGSVPQNAASAATATATANATTAGDAINLLLLLSPPSLSPPSRRVALPALSRQWHWPSSRAL